MDFALRLALRYMGSKKKRASISVGTTLAVVGVALGTCVLSLAITVTGGFRQEFRNKVLGVNAHVLVLKYASDFREYRDVMKQMREIPGVQGVAPFVINPMMVTHKSKTATGVLLKGVDPKLFGTVLDLPNHIVEGSADGLRLPGAKPPAKKKRKYSWEKDKKKEGLRKSLPLELPADAGAGDRFLKQLEDKQPGSIEKFFGDGGAAKADPLDGGAPPSADDDEDADEEDADADEEDAGADDEDDEVFKGAITPDGGYDSVLPEDDIDDPDILTEDDPCDDPNAALPGIIIGVTLKDTLGVELGQCVQVTSPTIGYTYNRGGRRPPRAKFFRVIAVFDAGFDQYDSKLVYTDLYEAQAFYSSGDSVTGVEMKVDDIERAGEIKALVDRKLKSSVYHTMDWEELNHGLFTALRIQQIMVSLALGLIILVAGFTPMATLIMVALDKKQEIAVMKAMGATGWQIVRAFLYQGAIIGVLGGLLGLGLGYGICSYLEVHPFPLDPKVYFISHLPVQVRGEEFIFTFIFAMLVCIGGSTWPAIYAARLRPAEAFREL